LIIHYYIDYQISNIGRIRHVNGSIINQQPDPDGYSIANVYKDNISYTITISESVANEFIPKPENIKQYQVEHIDKDRSNNKVNNLRYVLMDQYIKPSKRMSSSNYRGVSFKRQTNKWNARITINKTRINLGNFQNEHDAAKAYDAKNIEIYRSKAKTNFDHYIDETTTTDDEYA
jgi:acid phosphatase class B